MPNLTVLTAQNARRWKAAKLIRTGFDAVAKRLVGQKDRYSEVTRMTGVPWWTIAVIHQRESSQSFAKSLAQGDPWDQVSTHVPKGRGPFKSWNEAAVDALTNCPPYAAKWKDWSAGGTLTLLEQYNGLGYANKGVSSPYIWSGTDQYERGKYVADGVFDPNAVDSQLGCAGLLMAMRKIDPTIIFADEVAPAPDVEPTPLPQPKPDTTGTKHIAAGSSAAVTGGVMHASGMPLWACALGAVVVAIIAYLIFRSSK